MPDTHVSRRPILLTLALLALAALLAGTLAPAARCGAPSAREILAQAQEYSTADLALLEQRLAQRLADQAGDSSEVWRSRLIRLAMWGPLAKVTQWLLETLGDHQWARRVFFLLMPAVRWMSEPFLFPVETAGPPEERDREMDKVFGLMAGLKRRGLSVTLDNVGDASLTPEDAAAYRAYYLDLIRHLAKSPQTSELYLSLKLSALVHRLEEAVREPGSGPALAKRREIREALAEILTAAAAFPDRRILIRIDMEEHAFKNLTLEVFREVVEEYPGPARGGEGSLRLGLVIQAYLRDAAADLRGLAAWARQGGLKVPVRLVKGAYLVHEREAASREGRKSPVWNFKPSTDANFEALSGYLLLNRDAFEPAFATHNVRSMSRVMGLAQALSIDNKALEFQMLYGMGDPIKDVVAGLGYRLREYVPAGSLARGLKYAGRRFAELAGEENALARTMRGDFSVVRGDPPAFLGAEDIKDGALCLSLFDQSLAKAVTR